MSGMESQLLTPGLLRDLQSLNLRFLDLLGAASRTGNETGLVHGLPALLAARIGAMDSNQLREIAACPSPRPGWRNTHRVCRPSVSIASCRSLK